MYISFDCASKIPSKSYLWLFVCCNGLNLTRDIVLPQVGLKLPFRIHGVILPEFGCSYILFSLFIFKYLVISLKISCCKGFFANRNSVNSIDPFSPGSLHETTLRSQVFNGKEIPLAKGLKEECVHNFLSWLIQIDRLFCLLDSLCFSVIL